METLTRPPQYEAITYNPEQRLYDDTTTWLAEVLDGNMRTPFEYQLRGNELHAKDGSPLGRIFDDAIDQAEDISARDPRLGFELRRRLIEKDEYYDMLALAKDEAPNTLVVVSDFPPELMDVTEDVGGYNARRRQTMLRVITHQPDGTVCMQSQSLDGSNRLALEGLYDELGFIAQPGEMLGQRMQLELDRFDQEFLIDRLTGVYDRSMQLQFGGQWHAGRQDQRYGNTYDFVRQQQDLLAEFMRQATYVSDRQGLITDLAAAMRRRFDSRPTGVATAGVGVNVSNVSACQEMLAAGADARSRGEIFSGCGMSLAANQDNQAADELAQLGFGSKSFEDKFGPREFTCKNGHLNTRPHNKLIERCRTCKVSVRC